MPNGERAIVEHEKLMGYVLNPDHPVGKHHAYLFEHLLGITRANSTILRQALLDAANILDVEKQQVTSLEPSTDFGARFQAHGVQGKSFLFGC